MGLVRWYKWIGLVVVVLILVHVLKPTPSVRPTLEQLPVAESVLVTTEVHSEFDGSRVVTSSLDWFSWSLIDLRDGTEWGSSNSDEPSLSASVIKVWLAADYLRKNPQPSQSWIRTLEVMIWDSDNAAASRVYQAIGGREMLNDMSVLCGVDAIISGRLGWGSTYISSHDTALLSSCIIQGKVSDSYWTSWLIIQMWQVRGLGNFGIRDVFPEDQRQFIAIKNGWVDVGRTWYVNCLAIGSTWVLVIETRSGSFEQGTQGCVDIASQLKT